MDFLQKPSAWFSKIYLRVQSKNCGNKQFFLFSFQNFFDFWANFFQTFGQKISKKFSKVPSARPEEHFVTLILFKKNFKPFWIFCRNIWHGSQNSTHVSRVKIAEKKFFFVFFPEFFRILSKKFSDFWPKNFKKIVKTTFCVSTGTTCGFKFF